MPAQARKPSDWDWVFILDHVDGTPNRRLGEVAREREEDPVKTMIDVGVEQALDTLYMVPLANENQDTVLEIMREPRSLVTFSDGGAHVSQIMDSSLQTHVLSHWVRNSGEVTLEQGIKYLTWDMATAWELPDRGLLRRGYKADMILFDLDTVRARASDGRARPAGGSAPPGAEGEGLPHVDRQRRHHDARWRADRRDHGPGADFGLDGSAALRSSASTGRMRNPPAHFAVDVART